ncbi:GlcG/HbpS family heme-binding protein [Rhodococcus wratislaviensis]|uniref:Heme-binding protein n=1 Tax=Rhodococcus wratislaviensis NBRC 100605 TaxID=1219028 RepID=X0Q504_RHOWR|nr:heme-binding protein [Rhodococcus wratislaviensis]GAF51469.1 hypothetical protein RW1_098_00060 [Rhodococcus wratislaviensis NBRC 100605]
MTELTRAAAELTTLVALQLLQKAIDRADELGRPMAISIVDPGGNQKAFIRMDGAPLLAGEVAFRKAWSAVAWNMPTRDWVPFISKDEVLLEGVPRIDGLSVLPGGVPIEVGELMVGGIGVSGSHYSEDDEVAIHALGSVAGIDLPAPARPARAWSDIETP